MIKLITLLSLTTLLVEIATPITIPTANPVTPVPFASAEFTAPSLSPNTISAKLQGYRA